MVEKISTNVNSKEEFLAEIAKFERLIVDTDLKMLDTIIAEQRTDNKKLKERIEEIKREFKSKEDAQKTVVS